MIRKTHTPFAAGDGLIFAVRPDGQLVTYTHAGHKTASAGWAQTQEHRVRSDGSEEPDWASFLHVFALQNHGGEHTQIVAVTDDGAVQAHRYDKRRRVIEGSPTRLVVGNTDRWRFGRGRAPLSRWGDYIQVIGGVDGSVYAIDTRGGLHHYELTNIETRARLVRNKPTTLVTPRAEGQAWDRYRHIAASSNGALYAVTTEGSLVFFRHLDRSADGTLTSDDGEVLAAGRGEDSGWDGFVHVFAGVEGVLYGIKTDGSLVTYQHTGWKSGSKRFRRNTETVLTKGRGSGTGWDAFRRRTRLETVDGIGVPTRGVPAFIRYQGRKGNRVVTDVAEVRIADEKYEDLTFFFQNVQLFPDTVGDIISDSEKALAKLLAAGADAALTGTLVGLAGALGPAGWFAALWLQSEIKPFGAISAAVDNALDKELYRGNGRRAQIDALVEHLERSSNDVVALSEMWVASEVKEVIQRLRHRYPHAVVGPMDPQDYLPSGLVLLSKVPIDGQDGLVFRAAKGEDVLASKGVLWARLRGVGDVFVTHMQADNSNTMIGSFETLSSGPGETAVEKQRYQAEAVRSFMESCRNPEMPAILLGDFNLDASGGRLKPRNDLGADVFKEQKRLIDETLGSDELFDINRLRLYRRNQGRTGYEPASGLQHYKRGAGPVPARPSGVSQEEWFATLGLDVDKQIDNVFVAPGIGTRWKVNPLRRVDLYAEHDGELYQLSDHLGVQARVESTQRITTALVRSPTRMTARVSRVHCYLETHDRAFVDDIEVELTLESLRLRSKVMTSERNHHRFETEVHRGGPVAELTEVLGVPKVTVRPIERDDFSSDEKLPAVSRWLPFHHILGNGPMRAGETTTTRWWLGPSRGHGGEYAVEVEVKTTW